MPTYRAIVYIHVEDEDIIRTLDEDALKDLKEDSEGDYLEGYVERELCWAENSFGGFYISTISKVGDAKEKELWHWRR